MKKNPFEPLKNKRYHLLSDPFLEQYADILQKRKERVENKIKELTFNRPDKLKDFASGHEYYGLHKKAREWVFRVFAPNADDIYLTGDFSCWQHKEEFRLKKSNAYGDWQLKVPLKTLQHQMHYALDIKFDNAYHRRLDPYSRFTVQNEATKIFTSLIWEPQEKYQFKYDGSQKEIKHPFIYECHVGMSGEEAKVSTFREFTDNILPRIVEAKYNTIQIMAVMNHPYYGSFGYHVANFFSIASRFGNPEEFKELVDTAHKYGLQVIIDLVHSHSVKNELEGLGNFDGRRSLYFHDGSRGEHSAWDSLCFDYGKNEVLHFLLSNCRFFLDEYHIDGYRFDGVTSMLYKHHGLNRVFTSYSDYFCDDVDDDALTYLTLANKVIHDVNPKAVTVAEDVSGMIGVAAPFDENGIGFDYRMAMGVTDMWFKVFDIPDENWDMYYIFNEATNRRNDEKVISYVECHDQAIVGGQSAIFRLIGDEMYTHMSKFVSSFNVSRGIALHKLCRLLTFSCSNGGYLNFMGNEFGHPEWIDFPREGNNWSMHYARRQWHLCDDRDLHYSELNEFDKAMLALENDHGFLSGRNIALDINNEKKIISFVRGNLWFFFNFNTERSFTDLKFNALKGEYSLVLSTDSPQFGGGGHIMMPQTFYTVDEEINGNNVPKLSLYLVPRSAIVLLRKNKND